jgi:hypothetical protein
MVHFCDVDARADQQHAAVRATEVVHRGPFLSITITSHVPHCGSLWLEATQNHSKIGAASRPHAYGSTTGLHISPLAVLCMALVILVHLTSSC